MSRARLHAGRSEAEQPCGRRVEPAPVVVVGWRCAETQKTARGRLFVLPVASDAKWVVRLPTLLERIF